MNLIKPTISDIFYHFSHSIDQHLTNQSYYHFQSQSISIKYLIMFIRSLLKTVPFFALAIPTATNYCAYKNQVYIWGNGQYQARPDALLQFKNFTPKLIKNLPDNIVSLQFGQYYQAGITQKGQLYIWNKKILDSNYEQREEENTREGIRMLEKQVKSVSFTTGYIWVLNKKGQVIQYPIVKQFEENRVKSTNIGPKRLVEPLKGTVQLSTGQDHVLALNSKGEVFAMGDDTLGQCGQGDQSRHTHPPFTEKRVKFPTKVPNIPKIVKVSAGGKHSLALDESGGLYGWGSNSSLQLSHEEQFSQMNNPLICSYSPLKISKGLDSSFIIDIETGEDFNIVITKNNSTQNTQVFSFGNNLRGQLAINQIRHIKDLSRIERLSNYVMKMNGEDKKVEIKQIRCGDSHCIVLLNIGYVMQWGDNEDGQIGNKKRSPVLAPVIMKEFIGKEVIGVFAGKNNTGLIVKEQIKTETKK